MQKVSSLIDSYTNYYSQGIYENRYLGKVSSRSYTAVLEFINKHKKFTCSEDEMVLKVLDFGCGDGRYFEAVNEAGSELKRDNIAVELTGVDPVEEGLPQFFQWCCKFIWLFFILIIKF